MSLGLALGAIGAIGGLLNGKKQADAASAAARSANRLTARQVALFNKMLGMVEQADRSGQFDPEARIAQLERDTARYEAQDLGNLAGAMRVAGYKALDSETGKRLDAVKMQYRADREARDNAIRQSAFAEKLAAYGAINPGQLNGAIAQANRSQELALAQAQASNPAGFLSALMPYLQNSGSGSAAPVSGGSTVSLGSGGYMNYQPGTGLPQYTPGNYQLPVAWNPRPTYGRGR
jgi:hypothetical protein